LKRWIAYTQILRSLATAPIDPEVQRRITAGAQVRGTSRTNVFFTTICWGLAAVRRTIDQGQREVACRHAPASLDTAVVIRTSSIVWRGGEETHGSAVLTRRQCARLLARPARIRPWAASCDRRRSMKDKDLEA